MSKVIAVWDIKHKITSQLISKLTNTDVKLLSLGSESNDDSVHSSNVEYINVLNDGVAGLYNAFQEINHIDSFVIVVDDNVSEGFIFQDPSEIEHGIDLNIKLPISLLRRILPLLCKAVSHNLPKIVLLVSKDDSLFPESNVYSGVLDAYVNKILLETHINSITYKKINVSTDDSNEFNCLLDESGLLTNDDYNFQSVNLESFEESISTLDGSTNTEFTDFTEATSSLDKFEKTSSENDGFITMSMDDYVKLKDSQSAVDDSAKAFEDINHYDNSNIAKSMHDSTLDSLPSQNFKDFREESIRMAKESLENRHNTQSHDGEISKEINYEINKQTAEDISKELENKESTQVPYKKPRISVDEINEINQQKNGEGSKISIDEKELLEYLKWRDSQSESKADLSADNNSSSKDISLSSIEDEPRDNIQINKLESQPFDLNKDSDYDSVISQFKSLWNRA